jgi:cytochrome P450
MPDFAPLDTSITLAQLDTDPFPIYRRLRREAPVLRVKAAGRTFLTKATDTKYVKDNPVLFSSDDPNTPMKRAFQAHTLMRKDGDAHLRERTAMVPAFAPKVIMNEWVPAYETFAHEFVSSLPRGEVVDLFQALSGPYAARGLAKVLGMEEATDDQMQRWSQTLIDGAGNFGQLDAPFAASDAVNDEINALLDSLQDRHRAAPNNSAFSVMLNADDPIEMSQIYANIKIAIGGGINEPRDALNTSVFGLLTNLDQLEEVKKNNDWGKAFGKPYAGLPPSRPPPAAQQKTPKFAAT